MKQKSTHNLHIVLDSSIFRQDDNFTSSNLKQLIELGKLELVTIYIPWFIYRESTSGFINKLRNEIESSLSAIKRFNSHIVPSGKLDFIVAPEAELLKIKEEIEIAVLELWGNFMKKSKAKMIEFDNSKSRNVFEDYFKGNAPFSSLKNRSDIPDAFIYQALENISKFQNIHFITGDSNLFKEVKKIKNIKTYKDLDSFYSSFDYLPIKKEYESIELYTEQIKIVLDKESEILDFASLFLKDSKPRQAFEDIYLSSNNNEGDLIEVEKIREIKILKENIKYIDSAFYLPIEAHADCIVEYLKFKSDSKINNSIINLQTQQLADIFDIYVRRMPLILNMEVKVDVDVKKHFTINAISHLTKIKIDFDLQFPTYSR